MNASKHRPTMGDRLREVADRLTTEREVQIKATARILGAAAQMAQNHDRLIAEVSDMVQEDLATQTARRVAQLQEEFGTLKAAKAHFGGKARSWQDLAAKWPSAVEVLALPAAVTEPPPTVSLESQLQELQVQVGQLQGQISVLQQAVARLQASVNT
ncbi:MAG: hypothetical protein HC918_05795 [Oscillatoriales cyanobacterium SM2_1_8]|nr:hypothetical protein [Oscillatoriales cyanobacterium SM2_1_8]